VPTTSAVASLGGHGHNAVLVYLTTGLGTFFQGVTGFLVLLYVGVIKGLSGALGVHQEMRKIYIEVHRGLQSL
jgi:hypothetical protein